MQAGTGPAEIRAITCHGLQSGSKVQTCFLNGLNFTSEERHSWRPALNGTLRKSQFTFSKAIPPKGKHHQNIFPF